MNFCSPWTPGFRVPSSSLSSLFHKAHPQPQPLPRDPVTRTERMDLGGICGSTTVSSVTLGKSFHSAISLSLFFCKPSKRPLPFKQLWAGNEAKHYSSFVSRIELPLFSEASLCCPRRTPCSCMCTCHSNHLLQRWPWAGLTPGSWGLWEQALWLSISVVPGKERIKESAKHLAQSLAQEMCQYFPFL